tara:strand:- start:667 stop:873 length:207 start_codon:yes stop_codon:yes gene_type:complete
MPATRKQIQDLFLRVCKDSEYTLEWDRASSLTAAILKIHPLQIWLAMPDIDTLIAIATGDHPITKKDN